jgi:hypothetical protein
MQIVRVYYIVLLFLFNAIVDIREYLIDENNIRVELDIIYLIGL